MKSCVIFNTIIKKIYEIFFSVPKTFPVVPVLFFIVFFHVLSLF